MESQFLIYYRSNAINAATKDELQVHQSRPRLYSLQKLQKIEREISTYRQPRATISVALVANSAFCERDANCESQPISSPSANSVSPLPWAISI